MDKNTLRKQALRIRRGIPDEKKEEKSRMICQKVLQAESYAAAQILYAFMPYNGEPDIVPLIQDAWKRGKTVVVPKVYGDIMEFIEIKSMHDLASGAWGILEPVSDVIYPKGDSSHAVMLVPGCAFTKQGDRMGYGRGYYDRYLEDFPIHTIAVCYEEQIFEEIPTEETDRRTTEVISA